MQQSIKKHIVEAGLSEEPSIYTLIVDGNNLMKISGVCKKTSYTGIEYGMLFEFMLQLKLMLRKKDFDFVYVMFDGQNSGQLRYNFYPEYKANRGKKFIQGGESDYFKTSRDFIHNLLSHKYKNKYEKREEKKSEEEIFAMQEGILKNMLEDLFIRSVFADSVEGDDLISYYVRHKKPNEKIVIMSSDRDLTQLINETVCIYSFSKKIFITDKNFKEQMGIPFENVVLYKTICGDGSDNIKGIKGVKETTLENLVPEIKERKMTLNEVIDKVKILHDKRSEEKKKPLQSIENILNGITDGVQGEKVYEINEKIINLFTDEMMTKEAIQLLDDMMYAPLDPDGRDYKNISRLISSYGLSDWNTPNKFAAFFGDFNRIKNKEIKYFYSN